MLVIMGFALMIVMTMLMRLEGVVRVVVVVRVAGPMLMGVRMLVDVPVAVLVHVFVAVHQLPMAMFMRVIVDVRVLVDVTMGVVSMHGRGSLRRLGGSPAGDRGKVVPGSKGLGLRRGEPPSMCQSRSTRHGVCSVGMEPWGRLPRETLRAERARMG